MTFWGGQSNFLTKTDNMSPSRLSLSLFLPLPLSLSPSISPSASKRHIHIDLESVVRPVLLVNDRIYISHILYSGHEDQIDLN